jgi:predicted metal-dependent hydrolase
MFQSSFLKNPIAEKRIRVHLNYTKTSRRMQEFFLKNQRYLDKTAKKFYNKEKNSRGGPP